MGKGLTRRVFAWPIMACGVLILGMPALAARGPFERVMTAKKAPAAINTWRGITPLRSTVADVEQMLDLEPGSVQGDTSGPFKVEGGEVTFSYVTPSLAKIYRAPRTLTGKVFTIYFTPNAPVPLAELKPAKSFKRCTEELNRPYFYLVHDAGLVYQLRRNSEAVETIIYQPSRSEVSRLAVNATCAF